MAEKSESEGYVRPASQDGDAIDLRAYWRVIVRRRWVIASVFAAAVILTLLVTLRQTKIYAATATLIIDLNAPRVLNNKDVQEVVDSGTGGYWYSKEYYETQYKVITSRAVAQRVDRQAPARARPAVPRARRRPGREEGREGARQRRSGARSSETA